MKTITILFLCCASLVVANGWQEAADIAVTTDDSAIRETALEAIREANPSWNDILSKLQVRTFDSGGPTDTLLLEKTMCVDSVERPYVLYIPSGYESSKPYPLIVYLHGGVSRAEIIDDPIAYADDNEFLGLAKTAGWFILFPFGQKDATWWDDVGMANVKNLIRTVKRQYNIDNDRVWMAGFSDGASAGFGFAMLDPNDFGAVIALNGHMGVASLDGDLPVYARNFANTPVYAVTTDNDGLYPTSKMGPTLEMALDAGGDILYRTLSGDHSFSYAEKELPRIRRFLERHPRDPLPHEIVWECADSEYGRCRWFVIDEIALESPKPWHDDWNTSLLDDRITIGFFSDDAFEGSGVRVGNLADGETFASNAGLQPGDVIIGGGSMSIENMGDLITFKGTLSRGDRAELAVLRGNERLNLVGEIPKATYYNIFKRDRPSGMVRVRYSNNRVDAECSRVRSFRILVHPDMFNLDKPIQVWVNGELMFDKLVKPDAGYLVSSFLERFDRDSAFVAEITIIIPE